MKACMGRGTGHPMGPLTLADMVGLDMVCSVGNSMYEEFKREEYAPPPLPRRMIAAGRLGQKSGQGFTSTTSRAADRGIRAAVAGSGLACPPTSPCQARRRRKYAIFDPGDARRRPAAGRARSSADVMAGSSPKSG